VLGARFCKAVATDLSLTAWARIGFPTGKAGARDHPKGTIDSGPSLYDSVKPQQRFRLEAQVIMAPSQRPRLWLAPRISGRRLRRDAFPDRPIKFADRANSLPVRPIYLPVRSSREFACRDARKSKTCRHGFCRRMAWKLPSSQFLPVDQGSATSHSSRNFGLRFSRKAVMPSTASAV